MCWQTWGYDSLDDTRTIKIGLISWDYSIHVESMILRYASSKMQLSS
jgi:hypothetical protein